MENFSGETSSALMTYLRADERNVADFLKPIGETKAITDIDGLRVALKGGRIIHFRPSGNAPEMRCYVEAENHTAATTLLRSGLSRIEEWARKRKAA